MTTGDVPGLITFGPTTTRGGRGHYNPMTDGPQILGSMNFEVSDLKEIVADLDLKELCEEVTAKTGTPNRIGSYQFTHTGNLFYPCDPRPEEVFIRDIARGLSTQHRFNGQTITRMTIAEHSYITSFIGPPETALERLMHDSPEAYIGDQIRPMKVIPLFGQIYLKIEAGIEAAICKRYNLRSPLLQGDVKFADETVLKAELARNIGSKADPLWDDASVKANDDTPLYFWRTELAEAHFLARFRELAGDRGIEQF